MCFCTLLKSGQKMCFFICPFFKKINSLWVALILFLIACFSKYSSKNRMANWYVSRGNTFMGVLLWLPWTLGDTPWSIMCLRIDLIWCKVVFSKYRNAFWHTSRPWNTEKKYELLWGTYIVLASINTVHRYYWWPWKIN